ncbi:MAG TPA: hypothetical protein VMU17_05265, partial [Elusimicrobiota bacterium]|nr:hypothetical protein [Elusimicrobiota bacterium]
MTLSKPLLVTLAGAGGVKLSSNLDARLRDGLQRRLNFLAADGAVSRKLADAVARLDPYSPEFLAFVLNYAWHVPRYDQPVYVPSDQEFDGRREVVLQTRQSPTSRVYVLSDLLKPIPDDTSLLPSDHSLIGISGHELSLIFQIRQLMTENAILEKDTHSVFNWALRLNWAFWQSGGPWILPLRFESDFTKVDNPARVYDEWKRNDILAARLVAIIQAYRNNVLKKQWQAIMTQQAQDVSDASAHAQHALDLYVDLANAVNPGSAKLAGGSETPVTDVTTVAARILETEIGLQNDVADLVGDADRVYLMTDAGRQRIDGDLAEHEVTSLRALKAVIPEPPAAVEPAPAAPAPAPAAKKDQPAKKPAKKPRGIPGVIRLPSKTASAMPSWPGAEIAASAAEASSSQRRPWMNRSSRVNALKKFAVVSAMGLVLPQAMSGAVQNIVTTLHWTHPFQMAATSLALVLLLLSWASYRRNGENGEKLKPWRFMRAHLMLSALLVVFLPGSPWLGVAVAAVLLAFVRSTLYWMHGDYIVNEGTSVLRSLLDGAWLYRYIHWMTVKDSRPACLYRLGWLGIAATAVWMLVHPIAAKVQEVYESFGNETSAIRTTTERLYVPVESGAPFGEAGRVENDPVQSKKSDVAVGEPVEFWTSPQFSALASQIESINGRLPGGVPPITGAGVLNTGPKSDYSRARVQYRSEGTSNAGSDEGRLAAVLAEIDSVTPLAAQAQAIGQNNQATTGGSGPSDLAEAYRIELTSLTKAASAILETLQIRDVKAKRPFTFVPNSEQLGNGATVDSRHPVALGQRALDDAMRFNAVMTEQQARKFESFEHSQKAIAVFTSEDGDTYYFRAGDLVRSGEPHDKDGFFSRMYTLENSGPLSRVRIAFDAWLPDGQKAAERAVELTFQDFYQPEAVIAPGKVNL